MLGYEISVDLLQRVTLSLGVISNVPLQFSYQETADTLANQEVTGARQINQKAKEHNNEPSATGSVQLTFKRGHDDSLPERVKLGLVSHPVRPFFRTPYRCKTSLRLGHVKCYKNTKDIANNLGNGPKMADQGNIGPQKSKTKSTNRSTDSMITS